MFDFYVACVRKYSYSYACYYWLPLKIYTSRSSCIRFFKSYKLKPFEFHDFAIFRFTQDLSIVSVDFSEVSNGKD